MSNKNNGVNPRLKNLFTVVDCLADLFGENCEVVLHDIERVEKSIVKIRNGHVTGRKKGGPLTDVALKMIKDAGEGRDIIGTYYPLTKDGRLLKSNATVIRDANGKIIGILCVNLDVSSLRDAQQALNHTSDRIEALLAGRAEFVPEQIHAENFENSTENIIEEKIRDAFHRKGKDSESMSLEDKLDIIETLNEKGVFYMKKAVLYTAESLNVSVPSVYRYLEIIRRKKSRTGKTVVKRASERLK